MPDSGGAALDTIVGILSPGHTAADLPTNTSSIPVVTDDALRNAVDSASALEKIAGGWPELTQRGFVDYLNDAAGYLRELVDAVKAKRPRGVVEFGVRWAVHMDGYPDYAGPFPTRDAAQACLNGSVFTGIIVARTVHTSDWVAD